MQTRVSSNFVWFLIVAVALHWMLRTVVYRPLAPNPTGQERADEILVEKFIEEKDKKPVIQTSKALKQEKDSKQKARFSGEFRNRVKKEQKASRTGRFRERPPARIERTLPPNPSDTEGEVLAGKGKLRMRDLLPRSAQPSRLPDDIENGSQTILNTDPVVYASFINRVRDELYDPWVNLLNDALQQRTISRRKLSPNLYVTTLKVIIDDTGNVVSINTLKSSGVAEIDAASRKAFWDTEPFPNPPFEFTEETRMLPLVFEFHFEYKNSVFGIKPWRI